MDEKKVRLTGRQVDFLTWMLERHLQSSEEDHERAVCEQLLRKLRGRGGDIE